MAKRKKKGKKKVVFDFKPFLFQTDKLKETKLAAGEGGTLLRIWGSSPGPFNAKVSGIEAPELAEFLMVFRPFILQNEDVFVDRVFNAAFVRYGDTASRSDLKDWKERWIRVQTKGLDVKLTVNGKQLHPRDVCEYWLNKEYFHVGPPRKASVLSRLSKDIQVVSKVMMLQYLSRSGNGLCRLSEIIRDSIKAGWSHEVTSP